MPIVATIIFQIFGNFRSSEIWRKFVFTPTQQFTRTLILNLITMNAIEVT